MGISMQPAVIFRESIVQCNWYLVSQRYIQNQTNIRDLRASQVFQHRYQVEKFIVVRVAEPAANRYSMLWVEDVACRRIINDDGFSQIASNLAEILDVVALVIVTAFSEQAVMHNMVNV